MAQRCLSEIGKNYFPNKEGPLRRKKTKTETAFKGNTLIEMIEDARENESLLTEKSKEQKQKTTREVSGSSSWRDILLFLGSWLFHKLL